MVDLNKLLCTCTLYILTARIRVKVAKKKDGLGKIMLNEESDIKAFCLI